MVLLSPKHSRIVLLLLLYAYSEKPSDSIVCHLLVLYLSHFILIPISHVFVRLHSPRVYVMYVKCVLTPYMNHNKRSSTSLTFCPIILSSVFELTLPTCTFMWTCNHTILAHQYIYLYIHTYPADNSQRIFFFLLLLVQLADTARLHIRTCIEYNHW